MNEKSLLKKMFLVLKLAVCYVLAVFFITTIGRIADIYFSLAQIHLLLGLLFLLLLVLPLVYLGWQIGSLWVRVPGAVSPPGQDLYNEDPKAYSKKCLAFCRLVVDNLKGNPNLDARDHAVLDRSLKALEQYAEHNQAIAPRALQKVWEENTKTISAKLDGIAEKEISRSAIFTSVGTAASQNSALDAVILIYQLIALTISIIRVYWTRPGAVVAFGLARDMLASAGGVILVSEITTGTYFKKATAYLNKIGDKIPGINIFTGFLDEGVQAGVSWHLVRRYGKTVMKRCRAIEWDNTRERKALVAAARQTKDCGAEPDTLETSHQIFELLRHFSWLEGRQDPGVVLCMFDYVREAFLSRSLQMELFSILREKPVTGSTLLQKARFWKKQAGPFEAVGRETRAEFLNIVTGLRPDGFSRAEERFVKKLK